MMRSPFRLRAASLPLVALIFLTLIAASCPPDRAALNTLKSLRATAEHSVSVVKAGRLQIPPIFTDAQEAQARDLYSKYLTADKAAAEILAAATTTDTSEFIAAVSKASADLVAFVVSIQKKVP